MGVTKQGDAWRNPFRIVLQDQPGRPIILSVDSPELQARHRRRPATSLVAAAATAGACSISITFWPAWRPGLPLQTEQRQSRTRPNQAVTPAFLKLVLRAHVSTAAAQQGSGVGGMQARWTARLQHASVPPSARKLAAYGKPAAAARDTARDAAEAEAGDSFTFDIVSYHPLQAASPPPPCPGGGWGGGGQRRKKQLIRLPAQR